MTALLDRLWRVDGFQDFAVELAIARRQLQAIILANEDAYPPIQQRREAHESYRRLVCRAEALKLWGVCEVLQTVCHLLDPDRIHPGSGAEYGRRVFAIGNALDRITRDVAMTVSQSSEWVPPPLVEGDSHQADSALLLENGARAAMDMARRLGRLIRVRVDQSPVTVPSLLLPVFHRMALQLARNAVVHGIEDTLDRRASGKPAAAVINMAVRTEGTLAVLHVKDDGRGIDVDAARAPQAATPSQLWQAIAAPGFSTAGDDVRSYAGRGVGLTTIQNILERLGGHAEARTWAGHGTHIRLCLPTES